jgi:hypothetical protein
MKLKYCVFFFLSFSSLFAQDENFRFRTSVEYGYFHSSFFLASEGGSYLSGSFGYKINEDFWLNLDVLKMSGIGAFEPDPVFINTPVNYVNTIVVPNFRKDWLLRNKLVLATTIGGALIFERAYIPFLNFDDNNNFEGIEFSNEGDKFNIGLFGNVLIKYEVSRSINFGINIKSYVAMYLEPEVIMIGPSIEIKL